MHIQAHPLSPSRLVTDEDTHHAYLLSLNERISSMPTSFDPNARLEDVLRMQLSTQLEWQPPPHTDATPKTHW